MVKSTHSLHQYNLFGTGPVLLPILGSVVLNTLTLAGLFYISSPSSSSTVSIVQTQKRARAEILERDDCASNPAYMQILPEERVFIESLVTDLEDTHLDSTSFGTFMIASEVYVHNSEQACLEATWNIQEELTWYNNYQRARAESVAVQTSGKDVSSVVGAYFTALHDEQIGFLHNPQNYQSRPLLAKKIKEYNCNSGTQWLTALATADPRVGDALQNYVYDDHVLSVLNVNNKQVFFENTLRAGINYSPEKKEGVVRPKETFVVEYLLARGVDIKRLPLEFQEWYAQEAAVGLIYSPTNAFGVEAAVGIRVASIDEEFAEIPSNFPMAMSSSFGSVIVFDSQKYNWNSIFLLANQRLEQLCKNTEEKCYTQDNYYVVLDKALFALQEMIWNAQTRSSEETALDRNPLHSVVALLSLRSELLEEKEAQLAQLYDDIKNRRGDVSDSYRIYAAHKNLSVSQLKELLEHPKVLDEDPLILTIGYSMGHFDKQRLKQQEGGQEVIDAYAAQLWQYHYTHDQRHGYCSGFVLPMIAFFATEDNPPSLEKLLLEEEKHLSKENKDRPTSWNDYYPGPYIIDNLDTIAVLSPDAFKAASTILDILFEREGYPGRSYEISIFCDVYESENEGFKPYTRKKTAEWHEKYCPTDRK